MISRTQATNGSIITNQDQIGDDFSTLFSELFTSPNAIEFDSSLEKVETCVSNEINHLLMVKFIELDVREAIFKMNPLGAPGLDGFPVCFYQNNWVYHW